jgi:hypothetical protein
VCRSEGDAADPREFGLSHDDERAKVLLHFCTHIFKIRPLEILKPGPDTLCYVIRHLADVERDRVAAAPNDLVRSGGCLRPDELVEAAVARLGPAP